MTLYVKDNEELWIMLVDTFFCSIYNSIWTGDIMDICKIRCQDRLTICAKVLICSRFSPPLTQLLLNEMRVSKFLSARFVRNIFFLFIYILEWNEMEMFINTRCCFLSCFDDLLISGFFCRAAIRSSSFEYFSQLNSKAADDDERWEWMEWIILTIDLIFSNCKTSKFSC